MSDVLRFERRTMAVFTDLNNDFRRQLPLKLVSTNTRQHKARSLSMTRPVVG